MLPEFWLDCARAVASHHNRVELSDVIWPNLYLLVMSNLWNTVVQLILVQTKDALVSSVMRHGPAGHVTFILQIKCQPSISTQQISVLQVQQTPLSKQQYWMQTIISPEKCVNMYFWYWPISQVHQK